MRHPELPGVPPAPAPAGILAARGTVAVAAEAGIKAAAQQLERQLQGRLAEWRAVYRNAAPAQAWLEGRIAFSQGTQKAELEASKRELDRKAREAARCIAQAHAAIAALADRRSGGSAGHAILDRQNSSGELV